MHTGTSPRTRGKHSCYLMLASILRNIPAHAGKTCSNASKPPTNMEHPRARGENVQIKTAGTKRFGTSPRTRGKLAGLYLNLTPFRNIPAHAGKTWWPARATRPAQEHPRARGENVGEKHIPTLSRGTSPRTRGKLGAAVGFDFAARNIPAHAGKTLPIFQGDR